MVGVSCSKLLKWFALTWKNDLITRERNFIEVKEGVI